MTEPRVQTHEPGTEPVTRRTLRRRAATRPGPGTVRALTLHQPWAALVALGHKTTENRNWRTHYRGPLLIHAGLARDLDAHEQPHVVDAYQRPGVAAGSWPGTDPHRPAHPMWARGRLVAAALLVDVHAALPGGCCHPWGLPWTADASTYHWTLAEAWQLPDPIEASGRQGLWHPAEDLLAAVWTQRDEHAPAWTWTPDPAETP